MVINPTYITSLQIRIFLWLFLLTCKQAKISLTSHHIKQCSKSSEIMIHISKNKPRLFPFPFQAPECVYTPIPVRQFSNTYRCWLFLSQGNTSPKVVKHDPQSQQGKALLWITPLLSGSVNYQKAVQGAWSNSAHRLSTKVVADNTHRKQNQPKFQHLNHTAETHVL